jgi:hypothetical protein
MHHARTDARARVRNDERDVLSGNMQNPAGTVYLPRWFPRLTQRKSLPSLVRLRANHLVIGFQHRDNAGIPVL